MARRSKLTPALHDAILRAVTIGVPLRTASELAGVAFDTVLEWIQRGEGHHPTRRATVPYVQFAHAFKKAEAQDQARRIARLEQAARGGDVFEEHTRTILRKDGSVVTVHEVKYRPPAWQADAWHLERHYPREWGRRDRLARKAQELAERYDLDADELIREAERLANGLDDDALDW